MAFDEKTPAWVNKISRRMQEDPEFRAWAEAETPEPQSNSNEEFIDERSRVYGEPVDCWTRVAQVWSGVLGHEVSAGEALLCMVGLKCVRTAITPDYADNFTDIGGYAEIYRRVIGDDMVWASTVEEYLQKREVRPS